MTHVVDRTRFGALLRDWRRRRGLSQLELALDVRVSARHLSFVETGRSRPSAELVLQLTERLDVPLRDRNQLLVAAGHAPAYGERDLDEPSMQPVRAAVSRVLAGHEPYPALAMDRHWELVAANEALMRLTAGVAADLLEPPVNVLRLLLHPHGLAPRIANLAEKQANLLERLRIQALAAGDPALDALHAELRALPGGDTRPGPEPAGSEVVVPLRLRHEGVELALLGTIMTFGTALDVTVSELVVESFFPADEATAAALRHLAVAGRSAPEVPGR